MINGIGGASCLDYLYQMQSTQQSTGLSADELFSAIDTNGDGTINKDEFEKHRAQKAQGTMPSLMNLLNGSVQLGKLEEIIKAVLSGGQASQDGGPSVDDILKKMDTDGDGKISKAEFIANGPRGAKQGGPSAEEIFNKIDTDGDGAITKEEFEKHHAERGRGHHGPPPPTVSQADMTSLLDSLQVSPGDGSTANTGSDQTGTNGLASFLAQAVEKYMQFAYEKQNSTNATLVNSVG
jgi:Ca2+-binding EF-hand superfamily protein